MTLLTDVQEERREEMKRIQPHHPLLAPRKEGSLRRLEGQENSKDGPKVGSNCTTRSTRC
jgi:hypothetical protein